MTVLMNDFVDGLKELIASQRTLWYNINPDFTSSYDLWTALGLSSDEFRCILVDLKWFLIRKTDRNSRLGRFKSSNIEDFVNNHLGAPLNAELTRSKTKALGIQTYFLRLGAFTEETFTPCDQFDKKVDHGQNIQRRLPIVSLSTTQRVRSSPVVIRGTLQLHSDGPVQEPTLLTAQVPETSVIAPNETFVERLTASIQQEMESLSYRDVLSLRAEPKETLAMSFAEAIIKRKHQTSANRNATIFGKETYDTVETPKRTKTPKLDQYHVPFDTREHDLLLCDLLSVKQTAKSSFNVGSVSSANRTARNVIVVPRSKLIRVNEQVVQSLLDSSEIDIPLLVTICRRINNETFLQALKDQKLAPPEKLSTEQLAALMKATNLSQRQMRTIRRFLHRWLCCKVFPSEKQLLNSYKDDGYAPYLDVAVIEGREFYYSYKLPDELLEFHLVRYMEQTHANDAESRLVDRIELVIMADHGKGSFRMITSILFYAQKQLIHKENLSTGNVEITEDSVRMMRLTFVSKVNESIALINEAGTITLRGNDTFFVANLRTRDQGDDDVPVIAEIPVVCFLNGDIKFLANCLGKERMAGKHCYKCRLSAKEWAEPEHQRGPAWTQTCLKAKWAEILMAEQNNQRTSAAFVQGVTGPAIIDSIPVTNVGVPQLHIELGMGKQVLYNRVLHDYVFPLFVKLNSDVYRTKRAMYVAKKQLLEATNLNVDVDTIKELTKAHKDARKEHFDALKDTKYMNDPIMIHIEQKILLSYNIKRSSYHGGDPEGPACRALFANADAVMTDLASYLRGLVPVFNVTHEQINTFFNANSRMLQHLDAITSFSRTIGITEEEIRDCEAHVRRFCSLWRKLGYSLEMVKFHLIEDHLIDALKEGNSARLEDPMEQFHQTASKFDCRSRIKDGPRKHLAFSNAEKRDNNAAVHALITHTMQETGRSRVREQNNDDKLGLQAERSYKRAHILTLDEIEYNSAFNVDKIIMGTINT